MVLLGESAVGKSAIVTRFSTGKFQRNNATIGAAYVTKSVEFKDGEDDYKVQLEIWDTAGQERYRSLTPMYYRNTDVALVVFDLSRLQSLSMAHKWIDELNQYVENKGRERINIVLVGNKLDLLSSDDGIREETLGEIHQEFKPVSAKTGEGIDLIFEDIVKSIPRDQFELKEDANTRNTNNTVDLTTTRHSSTCSC